MNISIILREAFLIKMFWIKFSILIKKKYHNQLLSNLWELVNFFSKDDNLDWSKKWNKEPGLSKVLLFVITKCDNSQKIIEPRPKLATIMKVNLARKFVHSHIRVMLWVMAFMVALTKMIAKTIVLNSLLLSSVFSFFFKVGRVVVLDTLPPPPPPNVHVMLGYLVLSVDLTQHWLKA